MLPAGFLAVLLESGLRAMVVTSGNGRLRRLLRGSETPSVACSTVLALPFERENKVI